MDVENSFENALDKVVGFLPNLLGFLLILLIGYIIAKVVAKVVTKLLEKVGVDRRLKDNKAGSYVDAVLPGASIAAGIAAVVFWLIFIFFIVTAVGALDIPAATDFMDKVLAYLPNVIVAILIFVVAALISGAVGGLVARVMGDTTTGKVVASVVPAVVMVIAFFMILEQLQIAPEIVRIAFGAVMFAMALALALAFGLGGRDVAARLLNDADTKARANAGQVKDDFQTGVDRAKSEAERRDPTSGNGTGTSSTSTAAGYTTGTTSTSTTGTGYGSTTGDGPLADPPGERTQPFDVGTGDPGHRRDF
ncbi:mechanosensitive ion channel family protein [Nocardia sp. N13]|uniref:mechanosensitive ion channel family protein n=1 Tax=Nocardioides sp. N13(2025) TaxID=3453405 RepID=UPI003F75AA30